MRRSSLFCLGLLAFSLLAEACNQEPSRAPFVKRGSSNATADDEEPIPSTKNPKDKSDDGTYQGNEDETDKDPDENKDPKDEEPKLPAPIDQAPSTHLEADFINSFIDDIAGSKAAGRGTGSQENKQVAEKIAAEFKALGFKEGGDNGTYFQAFSAKGRATQNIIGILPGETDEYIVMGAHMDHLGVTNGRTYPGADDNASGTTGLVASARAFAKNTVKLKRTLVFIAFSGEEMGLLGSLHFVKHPTIDIQKVRFMVNMDMIGRYRKEMDVIGLEKTIEGNSITRELIAKTNLKPAYLGEVSAGGSDHMPFKQIGIPTGTFHTQLHNEYHQPTDTLEKLDRDSLKTIAGIAADLAYRLAKSETITSANFALAPIALDGYTDGIHKHGGCEPGLVTFEEVQSNLSALKPLR